MDDNAKKAAISAATCRGTKKRRFLCVDEWQDIPPEAYEKLSQAYDGIYVYMDDGQTMSQKTLSSKKEQVAEVLKTPSSDWYNLTVNFRNTRQIHDAFHPLRSTETGESTVPPPKQGDKPKYYVLEPEYQMDHIEAICSKKPGSTWNIGIITSTKSEQGQIFDRLNRMFPNKVQRCDSNTDPINYRDFSIFVLNSSNVKGLEFHEVILAGVDESWRERNQLYVSATRASERLHVYLKHDGVIGALWLSYDHFERGQHKSDMQSDVIDDVEF